jgi:diacylglycerol kinase family enzyme
LVNPKSAGGRAARAGLAERARELGIDVVVVGPDNDLRTLVADAVARGADALGAAGGDGSLAVVAAVALERGLPFVCVPAGTRNHFALDVGVDRHDLIGIIVLDKLRAGRDPAHTWTAKRLEVTAPAPIHAGIDGEAIDLVPPLEFAIRPAALRVRVSAHRRSGRVP